MKHNFSPGPCILPQEVVKQASNAILNFENTELSILEISHRSKEVISVMREAQELALSITNLKDKGYVALFLQGGASTQFLMVAQNFLTKKAAYLDTGSWSNKAIKEAKNIGDVEIIDSSRDKNYNYIPRNFSTDKEYDYFHITTNNTIFGTQIKQIPNTKAPLIADMSSDIFSRKIDYTAFSLIYAGAQKNLGPAGTTLVFIKRDFLNTISKNIPFMLDYRIHLDKESMYNTPPVFSIYVSLLNLKWLNKQGGLNEIEKINNEKANLLYHEIDRNNLFKGFADKSDRSIMNVTFNLTDDSLSDKFDTLWRANDITNLSGHRSVGGYRASLYNALPLSSVKHLITIMKKFEKSV